MSAALEKNRHALEMMGMGTVSGGDPDAMRTARIGVWGGDGGAEPSSAGPLLGEALGDLLGRFWHRIDITGSSATTDAAADAARMSADACGAAGPRVRRSWDPPYDFAIGIGEPPPVGSAKASVTIGAGGWRASAGQAAALGADANPVGPLAAASLAAAEALKSVFAIGPDRGAAPLPEPYEWLAWFGAHGTAPPSAAGLDLGEVHAFGIGAVTHALLWALERWPGAVTGTLRLVDPDAYDAGNPQRYMGTSQGDIGRPKAAAAAARLARAHPGLDAIPYETDMNGYFAEHDPDCRARTALCGLDSREGRRQLGLKLPLAAVNMWTSEFHAGASTFSLDGDVQPCILCAYPEPARGGRAVVPDEASAIHSELGLPPPRARHLLDSGGSITESDARTISAATGVRAADIQLKPVRSVRTEMCATGTIAAPRGPNREDVHVPLAFASAMAGLAGFSELARHTLGVRGEPGQFQASVLRYPTADSWTRRRRRSDCRFCSDPVRRMARAKYACDRVAEAAEQ